MATLSDLPPELFQRILLCLPYDQIANTCRLVSPGWNSTSRTLLNKGFGRAERLHSATLAFVKGRLPRRESERRHHALARHSDILTAVETRLSLLAMTYNKFLDQGTACFIPGKVVDELLHILRLVSGCLVPTVTQPAQRPHELLQELRDISSMAMEHFDEVIAPGLKTESGACCSGLASPGALSAFAAHVAAAVTPRSAAPTPAPADELKSLRKQLREAVATAQGQGRELAALKAAQAKSTAALSRMAKKAADHTKALGDFTRKYDAALSELRGLKRTASEETAAPSPKRPRSRRLKPVPEIAAEEREDVEALSTSRPKRRRK